jgi:3-dehydrosphinganine reductase
VTAVSQRRDPALQDAFGDADVVITGGSEGIGYAVAALLVGRAGRVTLLARDPAKLARATSTLDCDGIAADVRDLGAEATSRLAQCSLLVCCAGEMTPGRAGELDPADYQRQMDVNYVGTVNCVTAALPSMLARRAGTIVVFSSTAALLGVYGYSAYGATKSAVASYAASLRVELAGTGVRVVVAYPPDTETPGLVRERALRPAETEALVGTIAAQPVGAVAQRLVSAVARGRDRITFDPTTAALVAYASVLDRLFSRYSAAVIGRTRRARHADAPPRHEVPARRMTPETTAGQRRSQESALKGPPR